MSITIGVRGLEIEKGPDPSEMMIADLEKTPDLTGGRTDGMRDVRKTVTTTMTTENQATAMEATGETLHDRTMIGIPATDQDTMISTEDIKNIVHIKCQGII